MTTNSEEPNPKLRALPFFKHFNDWSVPGTFVVSLVALFLSQAPPVMQWFSGEQLAIQTSKEVFFGNSLGDLLTHFVLDIRNTGGTTVEIAAVECFLKKSKPSGAVFEMPVRSFSSGISNQVAFPMTTIVLNPGNRQI
jgi:hypothetical protein